MFQIFHCCYTGMCYHLFRNNLLVFYANSSAATHSERLCHSTDLNSRTRDLPFLASLVPLQADIFQPNVPAAYTSACTSQEGNFPGQPCHSIPNALRFSLLTQSSFFLPCSFLQYRLIQYKHISHGHILNMLVAASHFRQLHDFLSFTPCTHPHQNH